MTNYTAIATNGMGHIWPVPVTQISAWGKKDGKPHLYKGLTLDCVKALLDEVKKSNQMQVYYQCAAESLNGKLDAINETPLYTNGQVSVIAMVYGNESILWKKFYYSDEVILSNLQA